MFDRNLFRGWYEGCLEVEPCFRSFEKVEVIMKWPRGKYNGMRIRGFQIHFRVNVLRWVWLPKFSWNFGMPFIMFLCFHLRAEVQYQD